jgi:acyl-CoA dehydrogenase
MELDFWSGLNDEHRRRFRELQAIGHNVFTPLAENGEPGQVNRPLLKELASGGVLPHLFPSTVGGSQEGDRISAVELCLLREALAWGCTDAETALALQGLGSYPILFAATEELRQRWLPRVANGDAVAAFALTEPDAGTDAASLSLSAERVDGGYRLAGEKIWISNAPDADVYTIFARTTPAARAKGVTAFVLEGDADGLTGERLDLLAPHPIGRLKLDGVFLPEDHVLGDVDSGFRVAMETLDLFRPSVGAFAVGMAQAALDATVDHAADRRAFGKPLRDFQAVSHELADMATSIKAARLLVYEAAHAYDSGHRVTKASAMAKLFATEMAQSVIDSAIQIHGARGLQRGHLLEKLYRDVRATRIYEGTTQIQKEIIARELYR